MFPRVIFHIDCNTGEEDRRLLMAGSIVELQTVTGKAHILILKIHYVEH